ncbi:peptidylprolyl isomerase [Methylolobus aquaticus]|uniref:FKBP-type peptidyl-prolyl cis-trans isomerase n=1 Tax=Methylotetracoccus oryzae TaxID=1919059 RepID=UPI00101F8E23|nr:peptidylprolyl isomerase [Methylotetracoccus oryzae]RYU62371.1 peptidylprolyl isomerase [Methylolobus aquaticus]
MQISPNKVVHIHYTLTDNDGEVLDSSQGSDPMAYIHGMGNIISGLEEALTGRKVGDRFQVSVPPEEAYGVRDNDLVQKVPKSAFHGVDEVLPGMQFHAESSEGMQLVTVIEVEGDTVMLDGNHPMAGMTLNFDVEVTGIRNATPEELDHGHVHGAGGHHEHD